MSDSAQVSTGGNKREKIENRLFRNPRERKCVVENWRRKEEKKERKKGMVVLMEEMKGGESRGEHGGMEGEKDWHGKR